MTTILLDIETAPREWWLGAHPPTCPDLLREMASVKAPANYGPEAAAKWLAEHGAAKAFDAWHGYSARPEKGQVVTVVALDWRTGSVFGVHEPTGEAALLSAFDWWLAAAKPTRIVAWRGPSFDFPFIAARATILGDLPRLARTFNPRPLGKPWEAPVELVDAAKHWPGVDKGPRLRDLDDLWMWTEPDPLDGDGGKVLGALLEGRGDQVLAHCRADVLVRLAGVWERLRPLWER
jgi:hypothetical protein